MSRFRESLGRCWRWVDTQSQALWQVKPARIAIKAGAIVAPILYARHSFDVLTRDQEKLLFPDSSVYLQIAAEEPIFQHFFYKKPFTVPAVYRVMDGDVNTILAFQSELAFWSWCLFGVVLCFSLVRARARLAGVVISLSLVLAPLRLGWTDVVLSESINDSLMALVFANAMGLALALKNLKTALARRVVTSLLTGTLILIGTAWVLTRDTNAVIVLTTMSVGAILWRILSSWRKNRWSIVLISCGAMVATFSTWTVTNTPNDYSETWSQMWAPSTSRGVFTLMHNVFLRILPDEEATTFFRSRGMPLPEDLKVERPERYLGGLPKTYRLMIDEPQFAPTYEWLKKQGTRTYALWILRHPWERTVELVSAIRPTVLSPPVSMYMPKGWSPGQPSRQILDIVRRATESAGVVLFLLLAAPLLLYRPRAKPLTGIALCAVLAGFVGVALAYYGDAIEIPRHCWPHSQQIVIGLLLALLARLDSLKDILPRSASSE